MYLKGAFKLFAFSFVFLSTAASLKICNQQGGFFDGNTCVCNKGYTGEKCEILFSNLQTKTFINVPIDLKEKLKVEIDQSQRFKREIVYRNQNEEGSGEVEKTLLVEENLGSGEGSTDDPEWIFSSCKPGYVSLSEEQPCTEVLSFMFTITSKSPMEKQKVVEEIELKFQKYDLLEIYSRLNVSATEIDGAIFLKTSSNITEEQILNSFKDVAADKYNFNVGDLDECLFEKACGSNQICENVFGSHTCTCKIGYFELEKNSDRIECESVCEDHTCRNKGECVVDIDGNPICSCTSEFGGNDCAELVRPWWQATVALGTVAGFLLLCFLVCAFVLICRKKKKKSKGSDILLVTETKSNEYEKEPAPAFNGANDEGTFDNGASMMHTTTTFKPTEETENDNL